MNTFFIVTSNAERRSYAHNHDRAFFSVPVQVVPEFCDMRTRLIYCRSPLQGDIVYPVHSDNLKPERMLTRRMREHARRIPSP